MIIKQIYSDNAFQNFTYLIGCPESKEALIVDPLDANKCLQVADSNGFVIKHILNTHEHMDHTAGNEDIRRTTGAKVIAFVDLMNIIDNIDRGVSDGDIINVGNSVELEVLYTPGHTMSHICLLSRTDSPALFSGDALFNAGAGNCYNGGDPETLYRTFNECFIKLPNETRVYPGHDYFANNLRFTLDIEPDNGRAKEMLDKVKDQNPNKPFITTLKMEKDINTFFRITSPTIVANLSKKFPDISNNPSPKDVFVKLRTLRNQW
ncbi:MAG: hydroxyacylglutathione hydrolase [Spirochaetota bacterium]|nr:hydroxyacylglutathione hydrolase [Spirochaetota bacterium]